MKTYDAIVIGTGGIGSAALYDLARRGLRVLGIDRFGAGHDRGSSHGQTRVIRKAYFEHADYVPLLQTAYEMWHDLEAVSGQELYCQTGLLQCGPAAGSVLAGVIQSSRQHNLAVDQLTRQEAESRWPGLRLGDEMAAVYEADAGYLKVEDCVLAHLAQAQQHKAELLADEAVVDWTAQPDSVIVHTEKNTFHTERLIVTTGAWTAQILEQLAASLVVEKKTLFWFATDGDTYSVERGLPVYLFERPDGIYYGFPQIDQRGIKVAEHRSSSAETTVDDPTAIDRSIDSAEQQRVERFLGEHLPHATQRRTDASVCMYTTTPDEHFIIDRHPDDPRIVFAAGMSGHGFKFAPVLGRALADLAIDAQTNLPIDFLRADRAELWHASDG